VPLSAETQETAPHVIKSADAERPLISSFPCLFAGNYFFVIIKEPSVSAADTKTAPFTKTVITA